jgi:hypothetical protein
MSREKSILLPPNEKFFGSASVVSSADRLEATSSISRADLFVFDSDCRADVPGLGIAPPVEQPRKPEAGISDPNLLVAPAGGPSAEDGSSLGCSASLGTTLSVIY